MPAGYRCVLGAAAALALCAAFPAHAQTSPSPEPVMPFNWSPQFPSSNVDVVVTGALTKANELLAGIALPIVVIYAMLLGLDCLLGRLEAATVVNFFVGAIMIFGAQVLAGLFSVMFSGGPT